MTTNRIGKWQEELEEKERRVYESIAQPALQLCGYDLSCYPLSIGANAKGKLWVGAIRDLYKTSQVSETAQVSPIIGEVGISNFTQLFCVRI